LVKRGLTGVRLVVSDAHAGLKEAIVLFGSAVTSLKSGRQCDRGAIVARRLFGALFGIRPLSCAGGRHSQIVIELPTVSTSRQA